MSRIHERMGEPLTATKSPPLMCLACTLPTEYPQPTALRPTNEACRTACGRPRGPASPLQAANYSRAKLF